MFFCVCVFHSSFVYARGHYTSRYTFLFPFVYIKWYVYILSTFVSKWITFSRKDNLNVKVSLMFLYKIYVNVSFSERSYTHTHTHKHIYRAFLSMRFSRREYWSGLPFPPTRNLSDPVIEPMSPTSPALAGGFFTIEPPGQPYIRYIYK